jgi:predicted helicase
MMHAFWRLLNTFENKESGLEFEELCKWLLETHPLYKSKLKQVWLWKDWPEGWGRDKGIDLIAEDKEGSIWAIQAKCYDAKYYVTKTDLDKFLSESTNTKIHHRLLIASTDCIGKESLSLIQRSNEVIPINQLMLSDLLKSPIEWPTSINDLSQGKTKEAFIPWPYQEIAINKVTQNLDSRGQLIMACGTGKTLIALWIYEKLNVETTLILLPSLLLLSKTLNEWLAHSKESFSYLPVCSDETVDRSKDSISLSSSELSFPSTTDVDSIVRFMKTPGRKVIFSTYQSSEKISEAYQSNNLKPINLVIADEAHRCAGKTDSAYSTILNNEQIPAEKRLFMTATPRIFKSSFRKKAEESGLDISSMDDIDVFGPVLHKLSFGEAINPSDGSIPLLTDYQVVVIGVDNSFYSSMITERELVKTQNNIQTDAQSFASHIGLIKAIKKYDLRRVISFHSRVSAASDFANKLPEVINWMPKRARPDGDLITNFVAGFMPTSDRNRHLLELGELKETQRYVLSNARCLSEGIDVPALDGIAFIDPRNSEIDIIQAVGRAIRLSEDKSIGTIVIPVFIEEHEHHDEVLNSSAFKKVWAVVNALRSHDESLGEQLDQLRYAIGKRGTVGKPDKIIFDLPKAISHKFEEALSTKLIESTSLSWEFWFGLLEAYQEDFEDCLVHVHYVTDSGFRLGKWTAQQRTLKKNLTNDKIQRLDEVGFIWNVNSFKWEQGFKELRHYYKLNRDCLVAARYATDLGYKLGNWVGNVRASKKELTSERIKRLDEMGFIWDIHSLKWEQGFKELAHYYKMEGHSMVPFKYINDSGYKLGKWVVKVRHKIERLTNEQRQRLDKVNFVWDTELEKFEKGFKELENYYKLNGDYLVPRKYLTDSGYKLGIWLASKKDRPERLKSEQRQRLVEIGIVLRAKKKE